jgi:murein DD-endopeptidase MepM/ murein hydrolase activator NlpD
MATPALPPAAGTVIGYRATIARALAASALLLLGLLVLIVTPLTLLTSADSGPQTAPRGIPAAFVPVYRESARAFDLNWLVLASVHDQETGFSTHPSTYRGVNAAGCCAGPFQFNVTNGPPSTWDTHRAAFYAGARPVSYPHPQAPHPSVYDDFDAAMAAGSLLHDNGADATLDQRTWDAVRAYNGSGPLAVAYADAVMTRARAWAQVPSAEVGPGASGATLVWPVRGPVSSVFCERRAWEACHPGIDIAVASGTAILAAAPGRVTLTQTSVESGGYGNYTCLQHTASVTTCYAHLARVAVRPGQLAARGQPIGSSDCTGRCFGPHLHFEVRLDGRPVCPAGYLNAPTATLCASGAPGS